MTDIPDSSSGPQGYEGYVLPAENAAEMARLMLQDRLITQSMGGVLPEQTDLSQVRRVLDIACGPGGWLLDIIKQYPHMQGCAFEIAENETDPQKRQALLTFVLVGGGPAGVELAGAIAELAHRALSRDFKQINPASARIVLVEGEPRIIPTFPASLTSKACKKLQQLGVEVRTGVHVTDVTSSGVMIGDEHIAAKNVIWTAGVKASPAGEWLGAEVDHSGRVKVLSDLTVPGHPNLFVIGDTACLIQNGKPLPGLSPVAMQEGRYVAKLIADRIGGKVHRRSFHYFDKGTLAAVGRSFAVADIGPLHYTGWLAWLTWVAVHIFYLIGFRNRLLVLIQYAWAYFTSQPGARIILLEHPLPCLHTKENAS